MSSTVNCSGPSRATRSSTTAILVQAVLFPVGKINVLETCSKSVPPGKIKTKKLLHIGHKREEFGLIRSYILSALTGELSSEVTITLKSMAVVLFFSRHKVTSPTPSLTSILLLANSTLTTAKRIKDAL